VIRNLGDVANAYTEGRSWSGFWRRGGPGMPNNAWTDMSYAPGIPVANYYAATPYLSSVLSPNDGILHGPSVNASGRSKYLHRAMLMPVAAIGQAMFYIHDIVMYYPFVDGDGGDQPMDNQITIPRYDGAGCKIMLVSQGAGIGSAQDTRITYTNSDGVQKTWTGFTANANSAGLLISGANDGAQPAVPTRPMGGPYILGQGDKGVKSIDSINMQSGVGGIFAACIVKPLGMISMQTNETTPIEIDFARDRATIGMTEVKDGAYINLIGRSSISATPATLHGQFDFIWS